MSYIVEYMRESIVDIQSMTRRVSTGAYPSTHQACLEYLLHNL